MRRTKLGERESNFQTPRLKRERSVTHREGQSQACTQMAGPVPGAGANGTTKEGCARQHFARCFFFFVANSLTFVTNVFNVLPTFFASGGHYKIRLAQRLGARFGM